MILANHGIISSSGGSLPLLLDTYSGAIVAYSLRKLNTAYTGYAIRVRRSSDDTSQDIGFKADGTLDTTALTTFVGANNGFVSIWYDQSTNGYNLSQSTAANQLRVVYNGSLDLLNGKVALTSNYNSAQVGFMQTTSFASSYSQTTNFHIGSHVAAATKYLWYSLNPGPLYRQECYQEATNLLSTYAGVNMRLSYTPSISTQRIIYALFNSTSSKLAINNNTGTSGNTGTGAITGLSINTLDSIYNPASYTQEFIMFQGDKDTDRTNINTNINSFYTIY